MATDIILERFLNNRPELREEIEKLGKMNEVAESLVNAADEFYGVHNKLVEAGAKAEADIVMNLFEELKALRKNLQSKYPECNFSTMLENIRKK